MKKIGITLHPYGEKKPAGLGRAVFEIARNILELDKENEYKIFLKNPKTKLHLSGSNLKTSSLAPASMRSLDICIFNTPVMPWWYGFLSKAKKTVVITYDFAYLEYSPSKFLKFIHSRTLKKADLIIAISEATKSDIINIFKILPEKIKVVYLGFNKICEIAPEEVLNLPEKFFLFVGAIKERKNVHGVLEAFKKYKSAGGQHSLVIAGNGSGEYFERVKKIAEEGVVFLGQITDANLSYLYQKAEALLYPSFIEGFGLPILEAQDCGLPVITSNISSLPEVAGEGAVLIDPKNTSEIAEAMKKISSDQVFRQNLIECGRENAKKFSWQKTAQEILQLL